MGSDASKLTVGFAALARSTFDMELAARMTEMACRALRSRGVELVEVGGMIGGLDEAAAAAKLLSAAEVDLLVVFQATFADSSMAVHLAENVDAPVLLWALPEERSGERLRLNSFCGINLAAHALRRRGRAYYYTYHAAQDERALRRIQEIARAGRVRRRLRGARIGRIGEHPDGFDSCRFDPAELKARFGTEVVQFDLATVFEQVRRVRPEEVARLRHEWGARLEGLSELDSAGVDGSLAVYAALQRLAANERLDGLAVRCWPQFFTELGCAACGAMSMLTDEAIPCSCETDVNGTLTQLVLQWLGNAAAFGSDLVSVEAEADQAVLWHCGLAPLSMADPEFRPRATIHSNRRMPLLMEFPLKPGRVTLARLSQAEGDFRLVVGSGSMLRAPLSFSGTSGVIRFDRPAAEVLDTLIGHGLEHHVAITYGDYTPSLEVLAQLLRMPLLRL